MSCDCQRALCLHYSSRDALTTLRFGALLFAFAYFLAVTPLSYLSPGVTVMQDAVMTVSNGFGAAAHTVNAQVADFARTEVVLIEGVGSGLAYVGTTIGDGAHKLLLRPADFRQNLRTNMQSVVRHFESLALDE